MRVSGEIWKEERTGSWEIFLANRIPLKRIVRTTLLRKTGGAIHHIYLYEQENLEKIFASIGDKMTNFVHSKVEHETYWDEYSADPSHVFILFALWNYPAIWNGWTTIWRRNWLYHDHVGFLLKGGTITFCLWIQNRGMHIKVGLWAGLGRVKSFRANKNFLRTKGAPPGIGACFIIKHTSNLSCSRQTTQNKSLRQGIIHPHGDIQTPFRLPRVETWATVLKKHARRPEEIKELFRAELFCQHVHLYLWTRCEIIKSRKGICKFYELGQNHAHRHEFQMFLWGIMKP